MSNPVSLCTDPARGRNLRLLPLKCPTQTVFQPAPAKMTRLRKSTGSGQQTRPNTATIRTNKNIRTQSCRACLLELHILFHHSTTRASNSCSRPSLSADFFSWSFCILFISDLTPCEQDGIFVTNIYLYICQFIFSFVWKGGAISFSCLCNQFGFFFRAAETSCHDSLSFATWQP